MNPVLAKINCPLCGNVHATVHEQANRGNKKYFRCYNGDFGDCGTIQCTGAGGQRFITKNMRPLKGEQLTEVVEEIKDDAKQTAIKAAHKGQKQAEKAAAPDINEPEKKPRRSMLRALLEDE